MPGSLYPITITVELLINGSWTDVSKYVEQSNNTPITITGGRQDLTTQVQPATATLTFKNGDGRFSPNYTAGPYFPYLQRHIQIRISASATSITNNSYSGFRFFGEIHRWPPQSDISAQHVYVTVTAKGPLRRVRWGGGQGSALTRYYASLTGQQAPIAYWPCEEDPDSNIIGAGIDGGTTMTVISGTPKWKAISDFNGSAPVAVINNSSWDGVTGSFGGTGDDLFAVPGTFSWIAPVSSVNCRCIGGGAGGVGAASGSGRGAGGGGEFAQEATLAVTVGNTYTVTVGKGGNGGSNFSAGADSVFPGDAVTVRGHGGSVGSGATGGAGGTGSVNTVNHPGGAGGNGVGAAGGGGGGSGGTGASGNAGGNGTGGGNTGGAGGAAVAGGGAGGQGAGFTNGNAVQGSPPGGGGGGGGAPGIGQQGVGAPGAPGSVELVYTPAASPPYNVIRFILLVPAHGGDNGAVILRAITGGTIARLDVQYATGGNLQLLGYSNVNALLFTSSNLNVGDGQPVMVSVELHNSGSAVAYTFKAIVPGSATPIGPVTGTQATASVGSVSDVKVAPNADVTKTAIGHISVQYALVPLEQITDALNGHKSEMGIDRFIRLCNEQALDNAVEFAEKWDHWGFEDGTTNGWGATNGAVSSSTAWNSSKDGAGGTHSLLLTANGAGAPSAHGPAGTSGNVVNPGDKVSLAAELFASGAFNNCWIGLNWYQSGGAASAHPQDKSALVSLAASTETTLKMFANAPSDAAYFTPVYGSNDTLANLSTIATDNVRVHPRMGYQTRKKFHEFLAEIEELDKGIMREARQLHGLKYRTKFAMINQAPALTLDYSQRQLTPPLAPVVDDVHIKNHIVLQRHKGSKVIRTLGPVTTPALPASATPLVSTYKHGALVNLSGGTITNVVINGSSVGSGPGWYSLPALGTITITYTGSPMWQWLSPTSTASPPAGSGRHKHNLKVIAEDDQMLVNLAQHLLNLGTTGDERYSPIQLRLAAPGLASLMSAVAGLEIGDFIKIINLPFWYPATTAKQLVIGYTENLSPFQWDIAFACVPESPYEFTLTPPLTFSPYW